jgi:hypothetical protein
MHYIRAKKVPQKILYGFYGHQKSTILWLPESRKMHKKCLFKKVCI